MRRLLLLLVVWLCLPFFSASADGVNRALLVGCDQFVTQENTAPSSENNVIRMAETLSGGTMNLQQLVTRAQGVASVSELAELIDLAFGQAQEGDTSYFYISTHGVWEQGQPNGDMMLMLSDGVQESGVTAAELRALFDRIPGTKVLILDACHAGAVIGKGVHPPFDNVFTGADYKVICSSGGAEQSWFWSGDGEHGALTGEGYFSGALVSGLSAKGGFGADDNRDGVITLTELKRYLHLNHGASTARTYPEEDDFPVLTYDAASFTVRRRDAAISNVSFNDDVLSAAYPSADFTFNMVKAGQVAYQLVYHRQGRWDFDHAELLYDNAERFGVFGDAQGYLSPGLKERSISLSSTDSYGYVLLQILTLEDGIPSMASSRVLCVPPETGNPLLEILTDDAFTPARWEELTFVVHHQYPCELSVTIEDLDGNTVRRLSSRQPSRPEQMLPLGSTFTWNGRLNSGELASAGAYRIRVTAYVGKERYEALSRSFLLHSE